MPDVGISFACVQYLVSRDTAGGFQVCLLASAVIDMYGRTLLSARCRQPHNAHTMTTSLLAPHKCWIASLPLSYTGARGRFSRSKSHPKAPKALQVCLQQAMAECMMTPRRGLEPQVNVTRPKAARRAASGQCMHVVTRGLAPRIHSESQRSRLRPGSR